MHILFSDVRLTASYGLTSWLGADLWWSLRIVRTDFELQGLDRRPIDSPYGEEIHHRTETLVGPTDPWLSLRATHEMRRVAIAYRVGITLPVGAIVENPFRLGREGKSHQHIQFGTGTFDPFAEVELRADVGRFRISPWALGRASLYRNRYDYRAGAMVMGGLRTSSDLWTRRFRFMLGALVYHEQPERWSGLVETEGNLGRVDVMIESSVNWQLPRDWSLFAVVRVPVWSEIIGAQLATPAIGEIGVAHTFSLLKPR